MGNLFRMHKKWRSKGRGRIINGIDWEGDFSKIGESGVETVVLSLFVCVGI
jgi:hypothetical protein